MGQYLIVPGFLEHVTGSYLKQSFVLPFEPGDEIIRAFINSCVGDAFIDYSFFTFFL
jgi:hypothetical protein